MDIVIGKDFLPHWARLRDDIRTGAVSQIPAGIVVALDRQLSHFRRTEETHEVREIPFAYETETGEIRYNVHEPIDLEPSDQIWSTHAYEHAHLYAAVRDRVRQGSRGVELSPEGIVDLDRAMAKLRRSEAEPLVTLAELTRRLGCPDSDQQAVASWVGHSGPWSESTARNLQYAWKEEEEEEEGWTLGG